MSKKRKIAAPKEMLVSIALQNRLFHSSMRDAYFIRTMDSFKKFSGDFISENPLFSHSAKMLEFQSHIDTTIDYAKSSTTGIKAEERASHLTTGFFREEILFIHLLEDCASACRYLTTRYSTTHELNEYSRKISSLSLAGKTTGYVSKILAYVADRRNCDDLEIKQILNQIGNGLSLANTIFGTIKIKKGKTD